MIRYGFYFNAAVLLGISICGGAAPILAVIASSVLFTIGRKI